MRYLLNLVFALTLALMGCSESTGAGGSGGDGGVGGDGGTGGTTGQEFPCTEQGIRDAIVEGGGPHTFSCDGPQTVVTADAIQVGSSVILDGEGNLTVDGNNDHGVFVVRGRPTPTLELRGFTVTGGAAENGAGINASPESLDGPEGELVLVNTIVSGNTANFLGGGIVSRVLTLTNSTVSGNAAEVGGGMAIDDESTLINSTVSGNTAVTDGGGIIGGGTLINSTVSGNTAGRKGAAINGGVTLVNTTVIGDMHFGDLVALKAFGSVIQGACSEDGSEGPPQTSNGYNIESPGNTCAFDPDGTDRVNVTAEQLNLGPLADNGGPTMTHALLTEPTVSWAVDAIPADLCDVDQDQRGEPRPTPFFRLEVTCDVGAFEVQPSD